MRGSPRLLAIAIGVGLAGLSGAAKPAAAQTRADCEGGIRFIKEALDRATDLTARSELTKALRDAERELGEGEYDECMEAVEDAKAVAAAGGTQTAARRPRDAPEYLQSDLGLPVGLEDAFVARPGEVETRFRFVYERLRRGAGGGDGEDEDGGDTRRRGRDRSAPGAELEIGLGRGLSAIVGTEYRLGNTDEAKSGELELGGQWTFLAAQDWRPALALGANVSVPYGHRNDTVETTLAFLASMPLGAAGERVPYLHGNLFWTHAFNRDEEARLNRFAGAVGIALPVTASTALVLDLVHRQEEEKGRISNFVEAGVRQVLPGDIVLAAGAGAGIGGSATDYRLLVGLQVGF